MMRIRTSLVLPHTRILSRVNIRTCFKYEFIPLKEAAIKNINGDVMYVVFGTVFFCGLHQYTMQML